MHAARDRFHAIDRCSAHVAASKRANGPWTFAHIPGSPDPLVSTLVSSTHVTPGLIGPGTQRSDEPEADGHAWRAVLYGQGLIGSPIPVWAQSKEFSINTLGADQCDSQRNPATTTAGISA